MKLDPRGFRLLIGVHTHGHITPPFAQSLAVLSGQLGMWGVAHAVSIVQDCFVTTGRDRLAHGCLEGDFTHLLFLDADLEFTPADVARLMAANKDVVAGAYRQKNPSGHFALSYLETSDGAPWDQTARAMQVDGTGTGFMLIRREVFERMAEAMREIRYIDDSDGERKERHAFFEQKILESGHRASEDILFCRRWRAMGGEVWVIPDLSLTHWGSYGWTGALADTIRVVDVA